MRQCTHEIIQAIEENRQQFWLRAAAVSGNTAVTEPEVCWVRAERSDWPNRIFRTRLREADVEETVRRIAVEAAAGRMPRSWTVGPSDIPASLTDCLQRHGFARLRGGCGMACVLSEYGQRDAAGAERGVDITLVGHEPAMLRQWSTVCAGSFHFAALDPGIIAALANEADCRLYGALISGQVAGTLLTFDTGEVMGIHFVSTQEAYRRRGIGSALVSAALDDAVRRGCTLAVLQASAMGAPLYRAAGFTEYCTLEHYRFGGGNS